MAYKFRVVAGKHHVEGPPLERGPGLPPQRSRLTYRKGDVLEADRDLDKVFNSTGSLKFERVHDDRVQVTRPAPIPLAGHAKAGVPAVPWPDVNPEPSGPAIATADDLASLTLPQLRERAAEDEIDLGGARSKGEILAILREAYGG